MILRLIIRKIINIFDEKSEKFFTAQIPEKYS